MDITPLTFRPLLQERVWGGEALRSLGKPVPAGAHVGESWEVADLPNGSSVVRDGPYAGQTLTALRERFGAELVGEVPLERGRGRLPILLKFLDARDVLSVQVHPGDDYAAAHENGSLGKTEMWVVVDAEPGATLICGLKPGTDRATLERAIQDGTVADCLQAVPTHAGDAFCMPAGRVHALGKGLVVYEAQQNSDVTYRLYDWDRKGLDGRPRALHVKQSLEVIDFSTVMDPRIAPKMVLQTPEGLLESLVHTAPLSVERARVSGTLDLPPAPGSFQILTVLQGPVTVESGAEAAFRSLTLPTGESTLVPAATGAIRLRSSQPAVVMRAYIPVSH